MEHTWHVFRWIRVRPKLYLKASPCPEFRRTFSLYLWMTLALCLLTCDGTDASMSMKQMCGVDSNWNCLARDTTTVPRGVMEVCGTCGAFWSNVPGLDFCCRCSDVMFEYCLEAVYGR